jgi:hypothetical protein
MRAWGEALELRRDLAEAGLRLRPEQRAKAVELRLEQQAEAGTLGAAEQFIARMVKRNLPSALGVWF